MPHTFNGITFIKQKELTISSKFYVTLCQDSTHFLQAIRKVQIIKTVSSFQSFILGFPHTIKEPSLKEENGMWEGQQAVGIYSTSPFLFAKCFQRTNQGTKCMTNPIPHNILLVGDISHEIPNWQKFRAVNHCIVMTYKLHCQEDCDNKISCFLLQSVNL